MRLDEFGDLLASLGNRARRFLALLGQTFGWFIYIRNLWLIYRANPSPAMVTADPAPEPELNK